MNAYIALLSILLLPAISQAHIGHSHLSQKYWKGSVPVLDRDGTKALTPTGTPITNPVPKAVTMNTALLPAEEKTVTASVDKMEVHFDTDSSTIKTESKQTLRELISLLKNNTSDVELKIVGFADHRGTTLYNDKLSSKRANSVKSWLQEKGLPEENLKAFGAGETLQSNLAEARVVEIHLVR